MYENQAFLFSFSSVARKNQNVAKKLHSKKMKINKWNPFNTLF
jgi:hypothetical protein